jgi:putative ABC transport system ATP-binding protein
MVNEGCAIALRGVRLRWPGAPAPTLDIAQFDAGAGERIFLHGPSGSGKSTLLGVLGGVLRADEGSVRLTAAGQVHELSGMRGHARDRLRVDHVGFVFQQFNLVPYLGVLENVLLPCRFSAVRRRRAAQPEDEARRLLGALRIGGELWSRPVTQLSVGQQQRVAAARALIGRPGLIVADEPTSALDAATQDAFIELLLSQCRATGATLLFVSHDRRLAHHFTRDVALGQLNAASRTEATA